MKLEKAFAEDIKLNITAEEADRRFLMGVVKSKFSFQCPDERCNAPVTCANLDRPKNKRKREPYYKVVGEHSSDCEIAKDIEQQKTGTKAKTDIYSDSDEYIDSAIRLNLQPPSTKRPAATGDTLGTEGSEGKARQGNTEESNKRKIQRSKTLSSLIDAFLAKESHMVQLPEIGVINIKDFFVEINGQDLSELEDEFRIYYGKAWFNKKENGYSIVFDKTLNSAGIAKRPSTYMPLDKLTDSGFKRFKVDEMERLADKKPKIVFILSQTGPQLRNGYINIWCEGPEYLDYRL